MYACLLRATRVSTACILAQVQAAARELLEAMRRTGAIPADLADFLSPQVAAGSAESRSASAPSASRAASDMATQGSGQGGPWPAQTAASDTSSLAAAAPERQRQLPNLAGLVDLDGVQPLYPVDTALVDGHQPGRKCCANYQAT